MIDVYSLNFVYGKFLKNEEEKNNSSNNENNEI